MSRQIKFRGKRIKNGEWIYGDLLQVAASCYITNHSETKVNDDHKINYYSYEVDTDTIGQFTGLYDSKGAEIYEGDMLEFKREHTSVVKWNNEVGAWCMQLMFEPRVGSKPLGEWLNGNFIEVVGNIHNNKALQKN